MLISSFFIDYEIIKINNNVKLSVLYFSNRVFFKCSENTHLNSNSFSALLLANTSCSEVKVSNCCILL